MYRVFYYTLSRLAKALARTQLPSFNLGRLMSRCCYTETHRVCTPYTAFPPTSAAVFPHQRQVVRTCAHTPIAGDTMYNLFGRGIVVSSYTHVSQGNKLAARGYRSPPVAVFFPTTLRPDVHVSNRVRKELFDGFGMPLTTR